MATKQTTTSANKTTTAKAKTTTKKEDVEIKNTENVEVKNTKKVEEKIQVEKAPRKYKQDDLVPCRSVTSGQLIHSSRKSGMLYVWSNYGDICEVEYRDLQSLRATRSDYLFSPMFVIEDEELVEQWARDLEPVYEKFSGTEDIEEFFRLPNEVFEKRLVEAPKGIRNTIKSFAVGKIEDGTLDSLSKINSMDKVLGTDLKALIK